MKNAEMTNAEEKRVIKRPGRVSTIEGRKNTKKKVVAKNRRVMTKEKSSEASSAVQRVAHPVKKTTAKRRGRPAITDRKTAAVKTQQRGRPISIEVLQRRLATAQETLKTEKEKRKKLAQESKLKLAESIAAKKELQNQVRDLKKELVQIRSEKSKAERADAQKARMESARDAAVEKFVEKWTKKFLASEARKKSGRNSRKRGRPRGS